MTILTVAIIKIKNISTIILATAVEAIFSVVEEADYLTFNIVSGCYAIDKNNVYDMRFGLMDEADRKTFRVINYKDRCYAKDKNGYYHNSTKVSDEQLDDLDFLKAKAQLDKL